jgi:hypothetical protein
MGPLCVDAPQQSMRRIPVYQVLSIKLTCFLLLLPTRSRAAILRQRDVSYVAPLPVEGSHVKVGYGVSTAGDNEVGLFRIRFNYAF